MSFSFACPECKAQIEVADELAGQLGQCPRCEHVFTIPAPRQPKPAPPKTLPAAPTKIPPTAAWNEEPARDRDKPRSPERARPRRTSPPPAPRGPVWPWLVGIVGAIAFIVILLSSLIVLVSYRKPVSQDFRVGLRLPPQIVNGQRVTVGQLAGQRATLHDGVFQVKSELTQNDPVDPGQVNRIIHVKRYEVELIANRRYFIEQDSAQFNCQLRIEDETGELNRSQFFGNRNAQIFFTPFRTNIYTIYASSTNPAFGQFTLTVREHDRLKPFIP